MPKKPVAYRWRNRSTWTPGQVALLRKLYAARIPMDVIAARTLHSVDGCITKARQLGLSRRAAAMPPLPVPEKKMASRPCLCCGRTFVSQGWHNRLCGECRRLG